MPVAVILRLGMIKQRGVKMRDIFKNAVTGNKPFWVLTITAIMLLVASWIVPPTGVIDPSVLAAVGELSGLGALWCVVKAMDKGVATRVQHKDVTIDIHKDGSNNRADS